MPAFSSASDSCWWPLPWADPVFSIPHMAPGPAAPAAGRHSHAPWTGEALRGEATGPGSGRCLGAAAGILAQSASQVLMFTGREDPMPRLLAERGVCPF